MNTVNPNSVRETSRLFPDARAEDIEAAVAYENIFVPALFKHWPAHVIDAAGVAPGDRTLDIACGTGVLTRELPAVVGEAPLPVGLDISPGMLEVAHRLNPDIQWRQGDANDLPFERGSFERVLCQYGLMFFPDRTKALAEMARVLADGGRLAVAVWGSLEDNPGYSEKVHILDRVAGRSAGDALRAPFCLGDRSELRKLAEQAGLKDVDVRTVAGEAQFLSMHAFVEADVRGWLPVMDVHLSEEVIRSVHRECARHLEQYENNSDGRVVLPASAHIVTAGC